MSKKKKQEVKIVNDKPEWPPMKNQIKGAIRRIFRLSPWMSLTLKKVRIEKQKLNKNGEVSAKKDVYYRCRMCNGEFKAKDVQVDHIDPVIPSGKTINEMTYDEIVERIFCNLSNLQVLCKPCHTKKTKDEKQKNKKKKETI